LTDAEQRFFTQANPLGFILFARNIESPAQVRALVAALRATVGRADAPVLIDQEGGRVQRLRPPHWRSAPPGQAFADVAAHDLERAQRLLRLNFRLIGAELADLGIDVDCAPVADVPIPGSHDVIGDRAYGRTPEQVAALAQACCDGLLDQGVMPIVKHIPGHGRAMVDSHLSLPRVDAPLDQLIATDFKAFQLLPGAPWAMTAHVVYAALDPERPATTSPKVIAEVIRGAIGFDGVLISDDLSMKALGGDFADRARLSLAAGCDVVLHCNGDMTEMQGVVAGCTPLTDRAVERFAKANSLRRSLPAPDMVAAAAELASLSEASCRS
jgi:beta-N-acetylhexosaminidase